MLPEGFLKEGPAERTLEKWVRVSRGGTGAGLVEV